MHAATPSTFMTDERTCPNLFTRQSERPGGKQQLKHMFKQQWPLEEQAARCICLEFVLQLIRERRVQMCVQTVEMSICLPVLCSQWRGDEQKRIMWQQQRRHLGSTKTADETFERLMENTKEFLPPGSRKQFLKLPFSKHPFFQSPHSLLICKETKKLAVFGLSP